MALIGPESTCAICDGSLDRPYTATSGVAFTIDARLWPYCDAPLHFDCLPDWADREEFARAYFVSRLAAYWSRYGTLLSATAEWFLACGPAAPREDPYFAEVPLARWPLRLYAKWGEWEAFVDGGFRAELVGPAVDVADAVMAQVRAEVPSLEALKALYLQRSAQPRKRRSLVEFGSYLETLWGMAAHRIDWRTLEQRRQANDRALIEHERARADRIARANVLARRLAIKVQNGGQLACPHCRQRTAEMRLVDRSPDAESYFVCKLCGRSFSGSEGWDER
jgi:hypothetical protein